MLRRIIATAILLLAIVSGIVAYAGISVIYPGTATFSEVEPPVKIVAGSNANATGLAGTTLSVTIGANSTSVSVSFAITYQTNYIDDVFEIKNTDNTSTYYIVIRVNQPITASNVREAYMYVGSTQIDLTATGTSAEITLPAGGTLKVSFKIVVEEGTALKTTGLTTSFDIIYSPETPVPTPP